MEFSSDGLSFDAMYCNLCQKWNSSGCVVTRLDVVNRHEQSEMHEDAVFKEMTEDHGIDVALDNLQKKEFDALKDAQRVLYFLIEHNLPYLSPYEPLMNLCIDLGATNLQFFAPDQKCHLQKCCHSCRSP